MKYNLKSISMAFAALIGMGLTSCQNEDAQLNIDNAEGQKEYITVEAILDDDTRATLTQDKDVLKLAWAVDDKIEVVNASTGKHLGTLSVSEVIAENSKRCKFSGPIDLVTEETTLNLFYLSGKTMTFDGKTPKDLSISFASQDGTAASFNGFNVMIGKKENYVSGKGGQIEGVKFNRHFAYGYFILKCDDQYLDVTNVPVTISANTGTLHNVAALDFKDAKYIETEGDIIVTKTVAGNGEYANAFFVNFFPTSAVNLKFSCDVDGNHFEGTKGSELKVNTFYSNSGAPIVVEMTNTSKKTYTVTYSAGFVGANPAEKVISETIGVNDKVTAREYTDTELGLPEREGYTFSGWKDEDDNVIAAGSELNFAETETAKTLTAQWSLNETEVGFKYEDGNDNEIASDISKVSVEEAEVTKSVKNITEIDNAPTKEGYKFSHWIVKNGTETYSIGTSVTFTKDNVVIITLVPVWEKDKATVGSTDFETLDIFGNN